MLSVIFLLKTVYKEGYVAEISTLAISVFQGFSFLMTHIVYEPLLHTS